MFSSLRSRCTTPFCKRAETQVYTRSQSGVLSPRVNIRLLSASHGEVVFQVSFYKQQHSNQASCSRAMCLTHRKGSQTVSALAGMRKCFVWLNSSDEMRFDPLNASGTWELKSALKASCGSRGGKGHSTVEVHREGTSAAGSLAFPGHGIC